MITIALTAFGYAKKLKEVGFTDQQAETIAEIVDEQLATKKDLIEIRTELKEDIKELRTEIRWIFGLTIGFLTFVMTAFKFFH